MTGVLLAEKKPSTKEFNFRATSSKACKRARARKRAAYCARGAAFARAAARRRDQSFFEPRLRHDFSHMRVHTDARAAESARAVKALAYTVGNHIVYGTGNNAPETRQERVCLPHELAHAVQQAEDKTPRIST